MLGAIKAFLLGKRNRHTTQTVTDINVTEDRLESDAQEYQVRKSLSLIGNGGMALACVLSSLVLLGYALDTAFVYRFDNDSPSMNPFTAQTMLALCILAFCQYCYYQLRRPFWLMASLVSVMLLLKLVDFAFGTTVSNLTTLFVGQVQVESSVGYSNNMGVNTFLMSCAYFIALVSFKFKQMVLGHASAFLGLLFPFVALSGYLVGLDNLHGEMAQMTMIVGLLLGAGLVTRHAQFGLMRILICSGEAGFVIRRLCLAALCFPVIVMLLLGVGMPDEVFTQTLRWLVMSTTWFTLFLLVVGGLLLDKRETVFKKVITQLDFDATHDALTGLYNRRYFNHVAGQLVSASIDKTEDNLWAVMIDIDYFKEINDTHGHAVGDEVLRAIGKHLLSNLREADVVCRWGGEEFLILVRHTSDDAISLVTEKIKHVIESIEIDVDQHTTVTISVSVGVTKLTSKDSLNQLIERTDKALYEAKIKRNCIVVL